ncbi:MAG: HEAT repeat domain-containing protein [Deltaproteobacteria bacterium]|nr:HEAT repeat domain-containing protein [Deltaproteobacteria bacterium]
MSTTLIRRDLALSDPDLVAQGLRRLSRWLGTDNNNVRPPDFAERRRELADLESRLIDLSRSEDDMVRELATDALGAFLGDTAVERLVDLAQDACERVRASAVGALEYWPDHLRARELLLASSAGGHWTVRMRATRALGAFRGRDVVEVLLEGLLDPDSYVRFAAADALRRQPAEQFLPRLRQFAEYPAPHLLDAALDLLGDVGVREDEQFLTRVGGWFNLSQPAFIRSWARKAAKRIRKRLSKV